MAVAKFLFYLLVYSLIRLGDIVAFLLNLVALYLRKIVYLIKSNVNRIRSYSFEFSFPSFPKFALPKFKRLKFKHNFLKRKKVKKGGRQVKKSYFFIFISKLKYFFLGILFSALFVFLPLVFYVFVTDLPTLEGLSVNEIPQTTKIYDRDGQLLYEFYASKNRTIVALEDIPQYLRQATIAIEDQNFYKHPGFDLRGIGRAIVSNITTDERQGGSTITQQLMKSALLTPEPTYIRKTKEIVLALWAEQQYEKDEILELYFNYVPYGGTAWGVQAASEVYFDKDVSDLTLAESAFLAGLPRAPSIYSPYASSNEAWRNRQWQVLQAMANNEYISEEEAYNAFQQKLSFNAPRTSINAPHFVMYVKNELVKRYGLYEVERGGLQVRTTLDLDLQKYAEQEVKNTVMENEYLGIGNAASVVTDPSSGDILAMVGSKDFFDEENDGNVNLTTALRQPGSTIKLITYAAALENGFSEASIIRDTPVSIEIPGSPNYEPVNYDGRYHGMVPLRIAFANSYNVPAVKIAEKLGPNLIADYGRRMGISSWGRDKSYGLSITLGGNEVTMMDLATAYGVIANEGKKVNLDPILEIKDNSGKIVDQKEADSDQIIDPGVAFIVEDILSDNAARSRAFGLNSPLHIPEKRVSVKTGTTDNKRDNWTIGFTDDYVVATWVGNNDNTPLSPTLASGITGAAPLWRSIMENLIKNSEEVVDIPPEVVSKRCFGYEAYFLKGTESTSSCRFQKPSPTFAEQ